MPVRWSTDTAHPGTTWLDGVPFQEVSLGYPSQWEAEHGIGAYLREVTLAFP